MIMPLNRVAKIVCDTANALILEDGAVIGVKCEENTYYADSVIICCGGKKLSAYGFNR